MTNNMKMRSTVLHAIGGGWGDETSSVSTSRVAVIRGADFPAVAVGDTRGLPRRWEKDSKLSQRLLSAEDIVLEISGGTSDRPTGRSVFISQRLLDEIEIPVIPASFCKLVRIDRSVADPYFVYWCLQNMFNEGRAWNYQNRSTGIANFQFEYFLDQEEVPGFPLEEQRAIAATLGALDDKIESNRRAMTLAQDLGDALFEQVDSSHVKLEEIAEIVMGTSPKGEFLNETGNGLPFYQGRRDFGFRFPTLRVWTTDPKRQANANDVLLSVRAPVGDLNQASQTCCIGRGIAAIRSVVFPSTLYYAMRGSTNVWEKFNAEGTVFGSVTKTDVHEALIKWPKCDNLAPLEERLSVIDRRIASLERETHYLATLRDCLLPELMSGRVSMRVMEVSG